jgi:hypothetical protein
VPDVAAGEASFNLVQDGLAFGHFDWDASCGRLLRVRIKEGLPGAKPRGTTIMLERERKPLRLSKKSVKIQEITQSVSHPRIAS